MKLLITMPAHDAKCATETMYSIWRFARETTVDHDVRFLNRETSWVYRQLCAEMFYASREFTHWMPLDSDIGFTPALIHRMLGADVDVVGAVYLTRSRPCRPAVVMLPGSPAPVQGALEPVQFAPLGCAVISRAAIDAVAKAYPEQLRVCRSQGDLSLHQWFDTSSLDGVLLEPDHAFQHRWRLATDGTVWGLFCGPADIQHVGDLL